jgi:hypothetical protein
VDQQWISGVMCCRSKPENITEREEEDNVNCFWDVILVPFQDPAKYRIVLVIRLVIVL